MERTQTLNYPGLLLARAVLGSAPGYLGHAGPGPTARRIAFQAVKGGKEISHIRGPRAVATLQHANHGFDLAQDGRSIVDL